MTDKKNWQVKIVANELRRQQGLPSREDDSEEKIKFNSQEAQLRNLRDARFNAGMNIVLNLSVTEVVAEIDRKIQQLNSCFKVPDLKVVIRIDDSLAVFGPHSILIDKLTLVCNRSMSLIHASTLIARKNALD